MTKIFTRAVLAMTVLVAVGATGAGVAQGQPGCGPGQVCLYDGTGYSGQLWSFPPSTTYVGNDANDRASSVFNETSSAVRLFSEPNSGGSSICVNPSSGIGDLGSVGLSDAVSSIAGC